MDAQIDQRLHTLGCTPTDSRACKLERYTELDERSLSSWDINPWRSQRTQVLVHTPTITTETTCKTSESTHQGTHTRKGIRYCLPFDIHQNRPERCTLQEIYFKILGNTSTKRLGSWLVWLSGLSAGLRTKSSPVWFPVKEHAWVVGRVPGWGCVRGNQSMFLVYVSPINHSETLHPGIYNDKQIRDFLSGDCLPTQKQ